MVNQKNNNERKYLREINAAYLIKANTHKRKKSLKQKRKCLPQELHYFNIAARKKCFVYRNKYFVADIINLFIFSCLFFMYADTYLHRIMRTLCPTKGFMFIIGTEILTSCYISYITKLQFSKVYKFTANKVICYSYEIDKYKLHMYFVHEFTCSPNSSYMELS